MVKNKKNIKTSGESSMLHLKFKKYDVYTDSKHGTISIDRFKKLSPINHQSTKNKSKDDRYKIISLKGEGGESL